MRYFFRFELPEIAISKTLLLDFDDKNYRIPVDWFQPAAASFNTTAKRQERSPCSS